MSTWPGKREGPAAAGELKEKNGRRPPNRKKSEGSGRIRKGEEGQKRGGNAGTPARPRTEHSQREGQLRKKPQMDGEKILPRKVELSSPKKTRPHKKKKGGLPSPHREKELSVAREKGNRPSRNKRDFYQRSREGN